nr:DUF4105 domain-containing protein [Deltaproteobacteria bacterium]
MFRLSWPLVWLLWLGLSSTAAAAPPLATPSVRIDLVTVGPGNVLLTRAGHTVLLVTEQLSDGRTPSTAYNFGDTNFSDASIPFRFLFGHLTFFGSVTGDLYDTTEFYGLMQDRDVVRQPLALTQPQARRLAERLQTLVHPDTRDYTYHYLEQTCSTKVRDLIDEVTDGELRRQLGSQPDPWTVRDFQQL